MRKTLAKVATFTAVVASAIFTSCQPSTTKDDGTLRAFPSLEEMQRPFSHSDESVFKAPNRVHYPETWFHYIGGNVSQPVLLPTWKPSHRPASQACNCSMVSLADNGLLQPMTSSA